MSADKRNHVRIKIEHPQAAVQKFASVSEMTENEHQLASVPIGSVPPSASLAHLQSTQLKCAFPVSGVPFPSELTRLTPGAVFSDDPKKMRGVLCPICPAKQAECFDSL